LGEDIQDRISMTGHPGQDIYDRTSMTGHPLQDIDDRTSKKGYPGQDIQDSTSGTGHHGQVTEDRLPRIVTWNRIGRTDQFLLGKPTWLNCYPPCFTGIIPTKRFIHTGIFQLLLVLSKHLIKKFKK
jgi:hypothetical protein